MDSAQLKIEDSTLTLPTLEDVKQAAKRITGHVVDTDLQYSPYLSDKFKANIYLKREDQQLVRSFKIRGAINKILQLSPEQLTQGVVCASAGNHSQGVALSCSRLKIPGKIFMPANTPGQKVSQAKKHGGDWVDIELYGETFDDAYHAAMSYRKDTNAVFVHPFDDFDVICGQGTVGLEILKESDFEIHHLLLPVGGGGLAAGVSTVFKDLSPVTKITGLEPYHAAAMKRSLDVGFNAELVSIDPFVDGAATKKVGDLGFEICSKNLDSVVPVPESMICKTLIELYQEQAMVTELAGALSIAGLNLMKNDIKDKNVVCVLSGSNNDFLRAGEILARSERDI